MALKILSKLQIFLSQRNADADNEKPQITLAGWNEIIDIILKFRVRFVMMASKADCRPAHFWDRIRNTFLVDT